MVRSEGEQLPRTVGRYLLYGELAAGGMATVHLGRLAGPVGFSRTVAIKRLHPQYAKDPEFVRMFLDEARLCGRIRHPNVVPTLDVVTLDDEIFIVMEYVAGEALSKVLRIAQGRGLPVPHRVVATIVSSVLHGLHAAHQTKDERGRQLGIVHRDVSPQNILVGSDGTSRVLDFGVAKAAGRAQTTRDGQVKGKIAYMPPEQLSGELVTAQSDIYAASVVLWEALAGRRLFDGETETQVLVRAIEGRIPPPSTFDATLDAAADALVLRGLAREPAARFATARDMALAIERTFGLASTYEVGEWLESVASEEIARRAQRVAAIESASAVPPSAVPPSAVPPLAAPAEAPHSQVSSISVARAALSVSPPAPPRPRYRVLGAVAGAVAITGLALGFGEVVLRAAGAPAGASAGRAPNELARARRGLVIERPVSAGARIMEGGGARPSGPSSVGAARPSGTLAAVPPKPPASAAASCDLPFTIDPVTGRKKYKIECLK